MKNRRLGRWFRRAYSFTSKKSFRIRENDGLQTVIGKKGFFKMENYKLSHTTWNCKYHVVFAPKYRRKAFYGSRRLEIGKILRELCKWKGTRKAVPNRKLFLKILIPQSELFPKSWTGKKAPKE